MAAVSEVARRLAGSRMTRCRRMGATLGSDAALAESRHVNKGLRVSYRQPMTSGQVRPSAMTSRRTAGSETPMTLPGSPRTPAT